jgi:hypothetical protein
MKKKILFFCMIILLLAGSAYAERKTIGVSYDQIMEYLDMFIIMERAADADGQPKYIGQTKNNGMATLEIIGEKNNITSTTLMLGVPKDSPAIIAINTALLKNFIQNIAPEWKDCENWLTLALKNAGKEKQKKIIGDKKIIMSFYSNLGLLFTSVSHKDAT